MFCVPAATSKILEKSSFPLNSYSNRVASHLPSYSIQCHITCKVIRDKNIIIKLLQSAEIATETVNINFFSQSSVNRVSAKYLALCQVTCLL